MKSKFIKLLLILGSLIAFSMLIGFNLKSDFNEVLKRDCNDESCWQSLDNLKQALKEPQIEENQTLICKATATELEKTGYWKKTPLGLKGFLASSDFFLIESLIHSAIPLIFYILFIFIALNFNPQKFLITLLIALLLSIISIYKVKEYKYNKKITTIQIVC